MGKTLQNVVGSAVGGAFKGLGIAIIGQTLFYDNNVIEALQEPNTANFALTYAVGSAIYAAVQERKDPFNS